MAHLALKRIRTFSDDLMQSFSVTWVFRHRFAESPALAGPVVHSQSKVMCGDSTRHRVSELLDALDCFSSRSMLQDNSQSREGFVQSAKMREKLGFGIQYASV